MNIEELLDRLNTENNLLRVENEMLKENEDITESLNRKNRR